MTTFLLRRVVQCKLRKVCRFSITMENMRTFTVNNFLPNKSAQFNPQSFNANEEFSFKIRTKQIPGNEAIKNSFMAVAEPF